LQDKSTIKKYQKHPQVDDLSVEPGQLCWMFSSVKLLGRPGQFRRLPQDAGLWRGGHEFA
jgi:hypothetical protein